MKVNVLTYFLEHFNLYIQLGSWNSSQTKVLVFINTILMYLWFCMKFTLTMDCVLEKDTQGLN